MGYPALIAKCSRRPGLNLFTAFETSFTGGAGSTYRLTVGAGSGSFSRSATSVESLIVHRIGSGGVGATGLNPDATWTGFYTADWLVMKTRGTASCQTSMTAVTTANANATGVVTGFCAGTYAWAVRRSPAAARLSSRRATCSAECDDVDAGVVTVVQNGAAPIRSISRPPHLPMARRAPPNSQTLSITGGTPAYACTVAAGSLPSGLSISVATITGTPSGTGMSSFTVPCTDSAMAAPGTPSLDHHDQRCRWAKLLRLEGSVRLGGSRGLGSAVMILPVCLVDQSCVLSLAPVPVAQTFAAA